MTVEDDGSRNRSSYHRAHKDIEMEKMRVMNSHDQVKVINLEK